MGNFSKNMGKNLPKLEETPPSSRENLSNEDGRSDQGWRVLNSEY